MSATDMKLEVQIIAVSDVDRSKAFYERVGWRLDEDVAPMDGLRIVQFTPPGSSTSVDFGLGITTAPPGTAEATLVVTDIEAAREVLVGRDIEVSDIWHGPPFPVEARQPGPDPERASYGSFFSFDDPDGNMYIVQEVTTRRPGRIAPARIAGVDFQGAPPAQAAGEFVGFVGDQGDGARRRLDERVSVAGRGWRLGSLGASGPVRRESRSARGWCRPRTGTRHRRRRWSLQPGRAR